MSEQFDVFLCHNSQDKPEVIKIAQQLKQRGLKPWLDIWELPPGQSWQDLLEEQIEDVNSAAIFVGSSGFGPWQSVEMRAFIREFIKRKCPVIPVLLEDAPQEPELPILLQDLTWVDFRRSESNPMEQLIWGITRIKPTILNSPKQEVEREKSQARNFTEDLGNGINLDMITIPGGKFMMGSSECEGRDSERPQHEVTVQPFYMGKYPITQAQYQQVMGNNPSRFKGNERPVECVSWDRAVEFCQRLLKQTGKEYRLPSEAEWEYACRAGTKTRFYFGSKLTPNMARCKANIGGTLLGLVGVGDKTIEVGKYSPNAFGLYDMHGNVWEWCQDIWHSNYEGAPNDGRAWFSGASSYKTPYKVMRGGSWLDFPVNSRSVVREGRISWDVSDTLGFRVVCMVPRT